MSELNSTPAPQLTLTPNLDEPAPAEPVQSIQQAPAPDPEPSTQPILDDSQLTEAEKKAINDFIQKIDVTNGLSPYNVL